AAAKWLHLMAPRNGVSSSATGSTGAPLSISKSITSTLSWNPADQRQYSGVDPLFKSHLAKGRLRPREMAYQSGVALNGPSTKAGSSMEKPRPSSRSASASDRPPLL